MLRQRIATALFLAVIFLPVLFFFTPQLFAGFIALTLLIASWEWANLAGFSNVWQRLLYQLLLALLFVLVGHMSGFIDAGLPYQWVFNDAAVKLILLISCVWWAMALLWVQSYPQSALIWGNRWLRALMGIAVLLPTAVAFIYIRMQPGGHWLILLVVAVAACADIGAYFSGRVFGKHRLAPAVSPGKSWEGFWGGLACNAVLAAIAAHFFGGGRWALSFALIIPTSLASVLGDLVESMVKRHRGVKDSSQLLPGHGGIMDRMDSLTAAAPVFALALMLSNWQS